MNNISLLNKNQCTGCGLCKNVCPFNAIEMAYDDEGFLSPSVTQKCINCGLCAKSCPQLSNVFNLKPVKNCYASKATTDIREKCSSGGIFGIIAEKFIDNGGVVFGAGFNDTCDYLYHQAIDKKHNLTKIYKSKYLQSDTKDSFRQVKDLLKKGKKVLYSGCPCQIDALLTYVGKEEKNLFTIDILCHGVPSPKAYTKFLEEIKKSNGNKQIINVDFRDKKYGWGTLISVKFEDGTIYYDYYNGNYFRAFLSGLSMREGCYNCKYSKPDRVGDITLGDFWGVKELLPEADDGKGTSMVLINTDKGEELFSYVKKHTWIKEMNYSETVALSKRTNAALVRPTWRPEMRKCFFEHLKKGDSFSKSVHYAETSLLDVGILGWWIETPRSNYGSTLTDYALYRYILSLGLSCAMVSPANFDRAHAGEFNKNERYRMTAKYAPSDMKENNKYIDTFIVASDVLWYYDAFINQGYNFLLDFVDDNNKKISYATSFGNTKVFFPEKEMLKATALMKRFDAISVREYEGVEICKNKFNVTATHVLDPVFICDKKNWDNLANKATVKTKGKYLFSYMLDPTAEKAEGLKKMADKMGVDLVTVTDKQFNAEQKQKILENYGLLKNATIYDFIYHIKNAEFVVTDSYHGMCFSIILERQFIALVNKSRGASRFETLAQCLGIGDRFAENLNSTDVYIKHKTNYVELNKIVNKEIERSKNWLNDALFSPRVKKINSFEDRVYREIVSLSTKLDILEQRVNSLENHSK